MSAQGGPRGALAAVALAALAALAPPADAQGAPEPAPGTGAEAFARRDFEAAARLWAEEAQGGSARAKLGLGLISDLGLGAPRDAARALRWYLEAADDGLADAQFNVAVMLDAGTGTPRDTAAAAVWYARAAAEGHLRAQYNLGLLYEVGDGVPRNADLARHWLSLAAGELTAAAERLSGLVPPAPSDRVLAPPDPLSGAIVEGDDGPSAELVWTAPPGPEGSRFVAEIARLPEDGETAGRILTARETEASAIVAAVPGGGGEIAWRVSRAEAADRAVGEVPRYAAGPWRRLGEGEAPLPRGRVRVRLREGDALAGSLADELVDSLSAAGLWVGIERVDDVPAESAVRYAYAQDRDLARDIAAFLPVLEAGDAAPDPEAGLAPGEVEVWLVGALDET